MSSVALLFWKDSSHRSSGMAPSLLACVGGYFERTLVFDLEQNMYFPGESPCTCVSIPTWAI